MSDMAAHEEHEDGQVQTTEALIEQLSISDASSISNDSTKIDSAYSPTTSIISMASSTSQRTKTFTSSPDPVIPSNSTANISIREYIYFIPHPPPPGTPIPYTTGLPHRNPLNLPEICFEPTSTLVLTSPNNTFVDIRLYKPMHPSSNAPLPNRSEPGRLEWAFAGTSTSSSIDLGKPEWAGKTSHSTWTHWLDSRHPVGSPNIPTDEGDMYTISPSLALEVGHAFHPALGRVSGHEELWRDVPVLPTGDLTPSLSAPASLEAPTSAAATETEMLANAPRRIAVTLRLEDPGLPHVRGVVVRVGQYCQGILMEGSNVTIERWEFFGAGDADMNMETDTQGESHLHVNNGTNNTKENQAKREHDGEAEEEEVVEQGWKRTARIGVGYLPCSTTFRPRVLCVGAVVGVRGSAWVVEEVWEW